MNNGGNVPRTVGYRITHWTFKGELYFNGTKQICNVEGDELKAFKITEPGLIQIKGDPNLPEMIKKKTTTDTIFRNGYWHLLVVRKKGCSKRFNVKVLQTETQFRNACEKYKALPNSGFTPYNVVVPSTAQPVDIP